MARLKPTSYSAADRFVAGERRSYAISQEARESAQRICGGRLEEDDFTKMETALAVAAGVWRARKFSADKDKADEYAGRVMTAGNELASLLSPLSEYAPMSMLDTEALEKLDADQLAANEVVEQMKLTAYEILYTGRIAPYADSVVRIVDLPLPSSPDFYSRFLQELGYMIGLAAKVQKSIRGRRTLAQGQDRVHIDQLLHELTLIFERHGLPLSGAGMVDLAFLLTKELPRQAWPPSRSAVAKRLKVIRSAAYKRRGSKHRRL